MILMCLTALPLFMLIMGEVLFTCLHASMLKWILLHVSICVSVETYDMLVACLVAAFLQNLQNYSMTLLVTRLYSVKNEMHDDL